MSAPSIAKPFWERRGSPAHDAHRLLLISYHFPPDTTIGARRWQKLAHAVTEHGWGLDVITRAPQKEIGGALDSLPAGVRVFGVPAVVVPVERLEHLLWRAYRIIRPKRQFDEAAMRAARGKRAHPLHALPESVERADIHPGIHTPRDLLRGYWAWLDFARGAGWARRAAALAEQIIERGVHEAVITSAPPHMTHEAGRLVSAATGLPFVMDMRDPWSRQPWLPESVASPLWYRRADQYERASVAQAALVVANTETAREAMLKIYPEAHDRIITVMNGSDDDPLPPHRDDGRFLIGYAGTIYVDRDPRILFRAAARAIAEEQMTPAQFGIEIVGRFSAEERMPLLGLAAQEGVAEFVKLWPPRPHAAALEFLAGATMLVVFSGANELAIPAKVFECMRFDAWLLSLAEPESAIAQMLRGTTADVVRPLDVEAIAATILTRYREYRAGGRPRAVARDDRFSRRAQARILLDAITRITLPRDTGARTGQPSS
jgi:hypothetical protein